MAFLEFEFRRTTERLEQLDRPQRLLFSLLCSERLLPGYEQFERKAAWGDSAVLKKALQAGFQALLGEEPPSEIDSLLEQCEAVTPSLEDFSELQTVHAQNCGLSVMYALTVIQFGRAEDAAYSAQKVVETVDSYLMLSLGFSSGVFDFAKQQVVNEHELMQRELSEQETEIGELMNVEEVNGELVSSMRARTRAHAIPVI